MSITVRALPGYYVADMRYVDPYGARGIRQPEAAWRRLFARGLPEGGYRPDQCFGLEIYRGAPETTSKPRRAAVRSELCLPVRAL